MRSLTSRAVALVTPRDDRPPVNFAPHGGFAIPYATANGVVSQLQTTAQVPTLYAIIDRCATAVSQLEWKLYAKSASGRDEDRTEVTSHAALDLWNSPNAYTTQGEFVHATQQHVDLTGEGWWVANSIGSIPISIWNVRPDRMAPVPSTERFLSGYEYRDPWGRTVDLGLDEVVQLRVPDPMNPYRGLSPVRALMTDLESARFATEWNRNFFLNSAQPGGIIELDEMVQDEEFITLRRRWDEQHRGIANAHRVAIIEAGKWVNRTFTMRDMQFVELMGVSDDRLLRGFAFPKSMLGIAEDVNRANAEAAEYVFAKYLTVPRADRIRQALNGRLLRMYGPDAMRRFEFDYETPVPEDKAAVATERKAKVEAWKILVDGGVDRQSAAEVCDLPDMVFDEKPAPVAPVGFPAPPQDPDEQLAALQRQAEATARLILEQLGAMSAAQALPARERIEIGQRTGARPRGADTPPDDPAAAEAVDLQELQEQWIAAVTALLAVWSGTVLVGWIAALVAQVTSIIGAGNVAALADLTVDTTGLAKAIGDAMIEIADQAAEHMVGEAAAQDVVLEPISPPAADLTARAEVTARLLADTVTTSAAREANRLAGPDADAEVVAASVKAKLDELTDATPRRELGSALTAGQHMGRAATIKPAPSGAIYASEILDSSTCTYCRAIHGRWIGSTDDLAPIWKLYPLTGYVDCLGRERCRGTFVGVWRDDVDGYLKKKAAREKADA